MTLAEKLGQLQQLDGEANGNFRPEHLELARKGLLGSTLNVRGGARTNQLQLYIRDVAASVTRPVKELKGFQRVTLRAGEKKRVEFDLGPEELGFYNRSMSFVVEPGEFKVMVGSNSEDVIEAKFVVH